MTSKAEEIADTLRTEILVGQYRAGERLPSERELATRFDANRGSVREAIKKLEQLGIADVQPGGVRVVRIEDATLEVLGYLIELDGYPKQDLVAQMLDVAGAMMSMSARSAVLKADDTEIDTLLALVQHLSASIDSQEAYHEGWRRHAEQFTEINRNLVLKLIGNGLKTQLVGRLQQPPRVQPELDRIRDLEFLQELESAIATRDAERVGRAITGHFGLLSDAVAEALSADDAASTRRQIHA